MRVSLLFLSAAMLTTAITFHGFANSSVAQTLADIVRPVFSTFTSNADTNAVARPTPFLLVEKNATYLAILVNAILCCTATSIEARFVKLLGRNSISAFVFALSFILLVLNAVLLSWNA